MAEVASAFVSLVPSARGFGPKTEATLGGPLRGAGRKLGGVLGKGLKLGALAGIAGLGFVIGKGIKDAAEYQKIQFQTKAVIKSTGGAANVSAKRIAALGSAVEGYSAFGNDAVETGANLLLTFTQIKNSAGKTNKIFDQTVKASADMATALGTDIPSASLMLGKALNDPAKGYSRLMRSGVSFTESQIAQIKTLQKSGHVLKAQKIILGEVKKEFGGSARAAGKTFAGSLSRLKNQFGDLIRDALLPVLPKLTKFVKILADKMPGAIKWAIDKIKGLADSLKPVVDRIKPVVKGLRNLTNINFDKLDGKKLGTQLGKALADGVTTLGKISGKITKAIGKLFEKVDWVGIGIDIGRQVPALLLGLVAGILNFDFGGLLKGIGKHWLDVLLGILFIAFAPTKIVGPIGKLLSKIPFVGKFLEIAILWINKLGGKLLSFGGDLMKTFFRGFADQFPKAGGLIKGIVASLKNLPIRIGEFFIRLQIRIGVWALDAFRAMGRGAGRAVIAVAKFVARIPGRLLRALGSLIRLLSPRGYEMLVGLRNGIVRGLGGALKFLRGIPGKALRAVGTLGKTLFNSGKGLIQGLIDGMTAKLGPLVKLAKKLASLVGIHFPGSPIKAGPLKSWNNGGAGKRLVGLLADGLRDTRPVDVAMNALSSRIAVRSPSLDMSASASGGGGGAGGGATFHLYDSNNVLLGTMRGVADGAVSSQRGLDRQTSRASRIPAGAR